MSDAPTNKDIPQFRFTDPQQAKVNQFLALFGQGPAAMFRDACAIMNGRYDLIATTHIVGHLAREVLGALLEVLIPPDKESELKGEGANARKASFALSALGFSSTDFVWQFWIKDVIGGDFQLHRFAHRGGLSAPRPLNADFRVFWRDFVEFLDQLLNATRDHLLEISRPYEELARKPDPSLDDIKTISEKLPHHPVYLRRFFENIESTEWISLLDDRGYFDGAPRAVAIDGQLRTDPWPQGELLVRIAPQAPKQVSEILQRVDWPWNPYTIFRDTIVIIKSIDVPNARPLVSKLLSWIDVHGLAIIDHYVGELTEHLGQNGAADLAIRLADKLLDFDDDARRLHRLSGPATIVEEYTFEQTVRKWIEPTVTSLPLEALALLSGKLRDGIALVALDFSSPELVFEMHGCELVDNERPRTLYGVLAVLARAIRDHACTAITLGVITPKEICSLLDQYSPGVFVRLKYCILARNISMSGDIIRPLLLDRERSLAPWLFTEFNFLAEHGFDVLTDTERSRYLTMVSLVPPHVDRATGPTRTRIFEQWQLTRLTAIVKHLPPEWRAKYDKLYQIHAQAVHAAEQARKGGPIYYEGQSDFEQMAEMEIQDMVNYVNDRRSEQDNDQFSRYELHRALEGRVSSGPQIFAQNVRLLNELDFDSLRWCFSGMLRAVREKKCFEWLPIIEFASDVYGQSLRVPAENGNDATHPQVELRKSILNLLEEGVCADECRLPDALLGNTLSIILMGMRDSDPTADGDLENVKRDRAIQAAINCTRGIAFDALYQFISRIMSSESHRREHWPPIRAAVDECLKHSRSHRLAVHAMLGQSFPLLWEIEHEWIMRSVDVIFPLTEDKRPFFSAAWEGYASVWRPSKALFADLRSCYSTACANIADTTDNDDAGPSPVAVRTAGHIVNEFGRQTVDFGDEDRLLESLFSCASTSVRREALRIAGELWSSTDLSEAHGIAFALRMQQLFEWRLNECRKCATSAQALDEVWAVGDWPNDGFTDVTWWLAQVTSILAVWNVTPKHSNFAEHLVKCASDYPDTVIVIIELLIDANHPEWAMMSMHKYIKESFVRILASDPAQYEEKVRQLVNRFSTRGVTGFDELRN